MPTRPWNRPGFRTLVGWALAIYWTALFVGTHLPPTRMPPTPHHSDKLLHFGAYGVLAFLAGLLLSIRRKGTPRALGAAFAVLAVYGLLDELLQIPVGRQFEFLDMAADWLGAACGLIAAALLARRWLRKSAPNGGALPTVRRS